MSQSKRDKFRALPSFIQLSGDYLIRLDGITARQAEASQKLQAEFDAEIGPIIARYKEREAAEIAAFQLEKESVYSEIQREHFPQVNSPDDINITKLGDLIGEDYVFSIGAALKSEVVEMVAADDSECDCDNCRNARASVAELQQRLQEGAPEGVEVEVTAVRADSEEGRALLSKIVKGGATER